LILAGAARLGVRLDSSMRGAAEYRDVGLRHAF